ncbi:MAG TPA: MFS transporter [Polyangia bacterium]|nr:MFS transporter [Polyangia bacterium]
MRWPRSWIDAWDPENPLFWERTGRRIARRNLVWSIFAENLGFSVWLVWSVVATRLPAAGFRYTTDQLFALVSLPGLAGALLRFPYTFAVPRFGGRNWTAVSALLLLIPTLALATLVGRPDTPFWLMALAAASAGFGGGNFASSMANISFFFPDRDKGLALGLNAAGGNLGVATVQLCVPLVVGAGAAHLSRAGTLWLPLIVAAAAGAFLFMDNLSTARSSFRDQLAVARDKHTWIVALLYIGTFGSFVGYSAAFPLLLRTQFPMVTTSLAFLGPLAGSLARPLGGRLADRLGGARVTLASFAVMAASAAGVLFAMQHHAPGGFVGAFLALFVASGLGNGSTFRMIPAIFRAQALAGASRDGAATAAAHLRARRDSAAVIGLASAVGALGGFFIPRALGASIHATGGPAAAFSAFLACYFFCVALTWWHYLRASFLVTRLPSLAHAAV